MNRDQLIIWFQQNYTDLYKRMVESNHNLDYFTRNPFHAEGSVWTHTMMVMTVAKMKYTDHSLLVIAGLLHDIGKPFAAEVNTEKGRVHFKGHEGISTFFSVEILNRMVNEGMISIPERSLLLQIISLHGTNVTQYDESVLKISLEYFRFCDKHGAVRNVDENIYSQYEKRKFSTMHDPESERECTLLVGLPCSGKSTDIESNFKEHTVVSRDNALMEYAPDKGNYSEVYQWVHEDPERLKEFDKFFEQKIVQASKEDKVVVDMTMLPLSSRRKMMQKLGKRNYKAKVFMTDYDEIQRRNQARVGKVIPQGVYMNMMKSFVMPIKEEGFSKVDIVFN